MKASSSSFGAIFLAMAAARKAEPMECRQKPLTSKREPSPPAVANLSKMNAYSARVRTWLKPRMTTALVMVVMRREKP